MMHSDVMCVDDDDDDDDDAEIVWVENFKTVKYYVHWWWWWWYTVMKNWNGLGRKLETVKYLYTKFINKLLYYLFWDTEFII